MIKFLDLKKINDSFQPLLSRRMVEVVESGWYLLGKEVAEFEKEFCRYTGASHTVACASGLDALTLIFRAYIELGILQPGDEVIVPANTYIASILSITENNLKPVLIDADPATLQIDGSLLQQSLTEKTKAILIVHLYGRCAFTPIVDEFCKKNHLLLIEDNAQAVGCIAFNGKKTGNLGNAAGHSFYPGKNLGALGDGGAVTTSDPSLAKMVRTLAFYGSEKKYVFDYCGLNSRLDEIQAAALRVKLPRLDLDNEHRRKIARLYFEEIRNPLVNLPYPVEDRSDLNNVFHIFPLFCERRDRLQAFLSEKGIQTLIHYPIPPHLQKCYRDKIGTGYPLPVTERIHRNELSLPVSQVMTTDEALRVVEAVNSFV